MATATLTKWGNSQGIVIPKRICDKLNMHIGDEIEVDTDGTTIRLAPKQSYTLDALMAGYEGPAPEEYDWGEPAGKELW